MPDGSIKLVGNSIKSKKMPKYIEKFLEVGIRLLLTGKGKDFLEYYYDYVDKIYNLQIPLRDIATVGKIKTSMDNYIATCKELTSAGNKKSRQAWYELVLKHNLSVNMGDTIYYINTGTKKNDSDVKRVTHYYNTVNGIKMDVTKELDREYNKAKKAIPDKMKTPDGKWIKKDKWGAHRYGNGFSEEDEIVFNCVLLDNKIIEDEEEHFCDDDFEYNVNKYIDMFNKRIRPLLVCFSRDVRTVIGENGKEKDNILITHPKDRKSFTEEQCQLVCGEPYNPTDQDTYEQLMTMDDKEIRFWVSVNKRPPYVDEIGMDWEKIKSDYIERQKELEKKEISEEVKEYDKVIDSLTRNEVDSFINEGIIPDRLSKIIEIDTDSNNFMSRKYNVAIGNIFDVVDKEFDNNNNIDEDE